MIFYLVFLLILIVLIWSDNKRCVSFTENLFSSSKVTTFPYKRLCFVLTIDTNNEKCNLFNLIYACCMTDYIFLLKSHCFSYCFLSDCWTVGDEMTRVIWKSIKDKVKKDSIFALNVTSNVHFWICLDLILTLFLAAHSSISGAGH